MLLMYLTGGMVMVKRIIAGTIVLVILGGSGSLAYAGEVDNSKKIDNKNIEEENQRKGFQVVTPDRDITTNNGNVVLEFVAPEGTKVNIQVFFNISLAQNKENFVASHDPIDVEIGALQRGWAALELRRGLSKIEIVATLKNGTKESVVRYVTVRNQEELRRSIEDAIKDIPNTSSTKVIKNITNSGSK